MGEGSTLKEFNDQAGRKPYSLSRLVQLHGVKPRPNVMTHDRAVSVPAHPMVCSWMKLASHLALVVLSDHGDLIGAHFVIL